MEFTFFSSSFSAQFYCREDDTLGYNNNPMEWKYFGICSLCRWFHCGHISVKTNIFAKSIDRYRMGKKRHEISLYRFHRRYCWRCRMSIVSCCHSHTATVRVFLFKVVHFFVLWHDWWIGNLGHCTEYHNRKSINVKRYRHQQLEAISFRKCLDVEK